MIGVSFDTSAVATTPGGSAVLVKDLTPGGPAEKYGLRPGDLLTAINHNLVKADAEFMEALDNAPAGQPVELGLFARGPGIHDPRKAGSAVTSTRLEMGACKIRLGVDSILT